MAKQIRDYVYISDRKLESFRHQYPQDLLRSVLDSLKIDTGILEIDFSHGPVRDKREQMAQAMSKFLRKQGQVGTVDAPKQYFAGTLVMAWGTLENIRPAVVFFSGATDETVVALGGRLKHALFPDEMLVNNEGPVVLGEIDIIDQISQAAEARVANETSASTRMKPEQTVFMLHEYTRGAKERFEFLAQRYEDMTDRVDPSGKSRRALLGSPVYVARALTG